MTAGIEFTPSDTLSRQSADSVTPGFPLPSPPLPHVPLHNLSPFFQSFLSLDMKHGLPEVPMSSPVC